MRRVVLALVVTCGVVAACGAPSDGDTHGTGASGTATQTAVSASSTTARKASAATTATGDDEDSDPTATSKPVRELTLPRVTASFGGAAAEVIGTYCISCHLAPDRLATEAGWKAAKAVLKTRCNPATYTTDPKAMPPSASLAFKLITPAERALLKAYVDALP